MTELAYIFFLILTPKLQLKNQYFGYIVFFYYTKKEKSTQEMIYEVGNVNDRVFQKWFVKF